MSEISISKSAPKTLPMKHKCLMYGAIALWESLKAKGIVCESNFMDVVNLDVGEQIKFLDSMIDVNYLEKEVVKPLQKAHKKALADAKKPVKEKKVRVPRAKKEAVVKEPVIIQTPVSYDKATEELVQELSYETLLPPLTLEKPVEEEKKKPKIRKQKEEADKAPKEKKPRKKAEPKVVVEPKVVEEPKEPKVVVETQEELQDYWMLFHENVRYWTTDENLKNGILYNNTTDEEGDYCPGLIVGNLVNGVIVRI